MLRTTQNTDNQSYLSILFRKFKGQPKLIIMKPISIPLKFGVLTALILIAYFLVLGGLGVNSNPFFSFFNAIIFASCLSLSLRSLEEKEGSKVNYKRGFEVPFFTGIIATIIFSIFFITYYVYNPTFAKGLLEYIGNFASTGGIFLTVVIMGIVTSMVVSFALMQLHKKALRKVPSQKKNNSKNQKDPIQK